MTTIPEAALDKHVALLGMTGAGKTSVIKAAIVEPDLEADRRVLIITPKDDWWGLRLSKTGKSKGYDVPIFGGWHGDYPLQVKDAALLAEAYGTMKGSAIFCTSRLSGQDRAKWFAAFAESLLSNNKGWVRVVVDEAHVYMPKQGAKGGGAVPMALHAGNELVSQGRSIGLRIVLASQRSAKLHNDSLTQCSCLVAMMLMAPHDREAVKDWIEDQADPEQGKAIIASLANLHPGEAWVWAPRAKMLERIQFPRPHTFDSSAAPDEDSSDGPKLAPVNLDALKGKLATVEADRVANDPKALRAEIARLTSELKKAATNIPQNIPADPKAIKNAEREGYARGEAKTAPVWFRRGVEAAVDGIKNHLKTLNLPDFIKKEMELWRHVSGLPEVAPSPSAAPPVTPRTPSRAKPVTPTAVGEFSRPQMRVLESLAMWRALGHEQPSREMVAAVAGYSPGSGGYNNLIGGLATMGAIGKPTQGRLSLQADGIGVISREDGRDMLIGSLTNPERKLVAALNGAGAISREQLAEATAYSAGSGGFNNLIGSLTTLGLVVKPQTGHVALSDWAQELLTGYGERIAA